MEIFKSLRSNIDRSQFDLEALLEKLEYDDEAIIRFVDEQIAYPTLSGTSEGCASGTLMSRAGNSLDQSVLLATLLRDAGFDARITQGRLSSDVATVLRNSVPTIRILPEVVSDRKRFASVYAALFTKMKLPDEEIDADVTELMASDWTRDHKTVAEANKAAHHLHELFRGAAVGDVSQSNNEILEPKVEKYFWVQYKADDADSWMDLHVALPPRFRNSPIKPIRIWK